MPHLLQIEEPASSALIGAKKSRPTPVPPAWDAFLELGFRPLYLAGCSWAVVAIALWMFGPALQIELRGELNGVYWHAHEMLWGFVATIAVGFLLTATSNWTGRNPLHGPALAALTMLWLTARLVWLIPGQLSFYGAALAELLFFVIAAIALARVIIATRNQRNYAVPLLVLGMGLADALFLYGTIHGAPGEVYKHFATGMLCMAVIALLVAGRVIPFFAMRALPALQLPALQTLGRVQLLLCVLALLLGLVGQEEAMGAGLTLVAAICFFQLTRWQFWASRKVPLLWVLYLAFAMLACGLLLGAARAFGVEIRLAWPAHVIGIGGFALMIIGMVTRTSLGHLGRPLHTDKWMVASFTLVALATVLRLLALLPDMGPSLTELLLQAAALAWILAFGLFVRKFFPMLVRPRTPATANATPVSFIKRNSP